MNDNADETNSTNLSLAMGDIFQRAMQIFQEKNARYGTANIAQSGILGVMTRLRDKLARMDRIARGQATDSADESFIDTAVDAINYVAFLALLRTGKWPGQNDLTAPQVQTELLARCESAEQRIFAPQKPGDVGYDLAADESVTVPPTGRLVYIRTRVFVKLPDGMYARLVGRSSTSSKLGLSVIEGTIDNGYTGELFIGVVNHTGKPVEISAGHRVAQIILHRAFVTPVLHVLELPKTDRGNTGFGSTGA